MKWGAQEPAAHDLSKLRLLGSVGEPINPEAWMWYHEHIGGGRCPIVDTWWQTETGAIMISPLPGRHHPQARLGDLPAARASRPRWSTTRATASSAAAATSRSPGRGRRCCAGSTATPSATGTPTGRATRAATSPATAASSTTTATSGSSGRVDDVMNVSGHRISTTEVESALVDHPAVAEAAVVGANDAVTGQAIMAYVIAARHRTRRATSWARRCASTSPRSSAPSPARRS